MSWSTNTLERIQPIYNTIIEMPFIGELMDGTLPLEKFQFYMMQDAHYLEQFGRSLSIIAAKVHSIEDTLAFIRFAEGAVVVENALHESYFKEFEVTNKGTMQPVCHHYAHFLKSTAAMDAVEVAVAAVLPCFWIYREVGNYIYRHQKALSNPYQKWIDTYAGEEFGLLVQKAIDICDRLAAQSTEAQQLAMAEAFMTSSRLEFQFWDAAYQLKKW